jgi:hypothetical protein
MFSIALTIVMIVIVVRSTTSLPPAGAFDTHHNSRPFSTGKYISIGHGRHDLNFDEWCEYVAGSDFINRTADEAIRKCPT